MFALHFGFQFQLFTLLFSILSILRIFCFVLMKQEGNNPKSNQWLAIYITTKQAESSFRNPFVVVPRSGRKCK